MVGDLSIGQRQRVEIARAFTVSDEPVHLVILDEPTSSLDSVAAEQLLRLIEDLRDRGVAVLYISHRMSDIRRLADRIVSMRDGTISGVFQDTPLDYSGSVRAMLGHEITEVDISIPEPGAPVLELQDLVLRDGAKPFSITCHRNEVVAITGLVGSGKSDLAAALFGLEPPLSGGMRLDGTPYTPRNAQEAIRAGVFLSAKDRLINAVVADFDITRNLTLPFLRRHSNAHFVNRRSERSTAERMIDMLGIVCQGPQDGILTLSGGNQQKVMVARWMAEASKLLILDEPFQGVDIQARRDIGHKIRETAMDRATIVFVAELDEALEIADRVLVMSEHSIVGEHRNENIDVSTIMNQVVEATAARAAG